MSAPGDVITGPPKNEVFRHIDLRGRVATDPSSAYGLFGFAGASDIGTRAYGMRYPFHVGVVFRIDANATAGPHLSCSVAGPGATGRLLYEFLQLDDERADGRHKGRSGTSSRQWHRS